jgi:NADH-quinone oxidoreductase subunit G
VIEGARAINRHSVISQGHYQGNVGTAKPQETLPEVMKRNPQLLMNIHDVSEVNKANRDLSLIEGPAHSNNFE